MRDVPNTDDRSFFEKCLADVDLLNVDEKIIGGDFNLVMDLDLDKKGGQRIMHENAQKLLHTNVEQNSLLDIWRTLYPDQFMFNWRRSNPSPVFVRLYFFLMSELIFQLVISADILPGFQTDHSIPYM